MKAIANFLKFRRYCTHEKVQRKILPIVDSKECIPEPELDVEFFCNPANRDQIFENIKRRKSCGDIDKVLYLCQKPELKHLLLNELSRIPNLTHPATLNIGNHPEISKLCGSPPEFDFQPTEFEKLAVKMRLLRMDALGPVSGHRSYIFLGDLADLEQALIHYTIEKLTTQGFKIVSVPDILPTKVIERCGLIVDGDRTLVYQLAPHYGDEFSLSGTAEMALAYQLMNSTLEHDELPLKMAAVSRCYRAEASSLADERGIYRVHQFTKVEMFVCSEQDKSDEIFAYIQNIQENLFTSLGLHFKVLNMPPCELGAPAFRKTDMEGWLPGRNIFGELSSCSNCTDFQSRRLNIKYKTKDGNSVYVHTLNGTACAVPRMLIAICETHQLKNGTIAIPNNLQPFMNGKTVIRQQAVPDMRTYKYKPKVM
ncbi:serine--tRNA ligase, mitochondrial isoform X1 [Belonocnema kinseyi]|uniref:serine--tRNA ligase, mitochondrial isoform X1 n=1 Tax=Belonocnema kinseyi TaxID=2817044 RepID=UPI00143D28DF|nr:serine--tRNA ligase, mitochondrial isoform X1 [Belonocnema kinseyi]XP_033232249.1 serine--tRNA ligase, mitochondrial isoform X1 [Belonocnema kinseyi]XP_033232250.1 serine--tRNA ligase, mitochondrial isoform X1 [Belonocnema kinseyi]